jgi:amino acid transporter
MNELNPTVALISGVLITFFGVTCLQHTAIHTFGVVVTTVGLLTIMMSLDIVRNSIKG